MKKEKRMGFIHDKSPEKTRRLIFLIVLLMFGFGTANASPFEKNSEAGNQNFDQQQVKVTGTVKDTGGELLPGVSVVVKGTTVGVVTNLDGEYQIEVPDNAETLIFSFVGMRSQEIMIGNQTLINVVLVSDNIGLDEVVAIGYGVQKKASLTSAVSTLKGEELESIPVPTLNNSIGGRMTGVLVRQNSGEPGYNNATIRIRGVGTTGNSSPLVIVDGIERSLDRVDPHDVKEVTVLKDAASVAPYGMRGSNGVILVTTKRGSEGGQMQVTYDGKYGWQSPTVLPEPLSSYEWASMKNAATIYEGRTPTFSEDDLRKFKDGSMPDRYANVNIYDEVLETGHLQQHSVSMSGGSEKIQYYGSIGLTDNPGLWGEAVSSKRYNYRSNVDIKLSENTKIGFDIAGSFRDGNYPGTSQGVGWVIFGFYRLNPTNPIFYQNGTPAGYFERNPHLDLYESGYTKEKYYEQYATLKLEQNLSFVKGLKFRANLSIDKKDEFWKKWSIPYTFYQLNNDNSFIKGTGNVLAPKLDESTYTSRAITPQVMLDYNNTWGEHTVSVLSVFEPRMQEWRGTSAGRTNYELWIDELNMGNSNPADRTNGGYSGEARQVGYAYRAGYIYAGKYIVEASGRYDGHYYFAPGKRFAFFPSFSAAWRVSDEGFMKGVDFIDNLKIRGSWGKSGNLAGSAFQYLRKYNIRGGVYNIGGKTVSSVYESIDPNTEITWEKSTKSDIGFDLNMWNGLLNLEGDYFYEKRSDMLIGATVVVPNEYGVSLGEENNGVLENRGIEFKLSSSYDVKKDWNIYGAFNFTFARNKILEIAEPEHIQNDPYRSQTGKPIGTRFGYKAMGYFQTQAEIDATPYAAALNLKPGDLKYWDRNEDDKINSEDHVVIGDPQFPEIIYGLTMGTTFKRFNIDMLWQGAAKTSYYLDGWASKAFNQGNGIAFKHHLDYWTPDNPDAEFPLATNPAGYNYYGSSHWVRDGSYIRLKTLTLSYDLGLDVKWAKNIKLYATGENLFFISKTSYIDPENASSTDYYWQQRTISVGATIDF